MFICLPFASNSSFPSASLSDTFVFPLPLCASPCNEADINDVDERNMLLYELQHATAQPGDDRDGDSDDLPELPR